MVTDAERRRLYDAFVRTLGAEDAVTLMELLPPVGWSDVARQSDVRELRAEIAELRAEVRSQLPKLITANIASMLGVAGLVAAVFAVAT